MLSPVARFYSGAVTGKMNGTYLLYTGLGLLPVLTSNMFSHQGPINFRILISGFIFKMNS